MTQVTHKRRCEAKNEATLDCRGVQCWANKQLSGNGNTNTNSDCYQTPAAQPYDTPALRCICSTQLCLFVCVRVCCGNVINPAMHSASFDFATLTLIYFMFAVHSRLSKNAQSSFALRIAGGLFGFPTVLTEYATADYSQFWQCYAYEFCCYVCRTHIDINTNIPPLQ